MSAVSVTLLTFAAECSAEAHSAMPMLVCADAFDVKRAFIHSSVGYSRTALSSKPATWHRDCSQIKGQTGGWTLDRFTDPAQHTV